jgi:hypothetical protein
MNSQCRISFTIIRGGYANKSLLQARRTFSFLGPEKLKRIKVTTCFQLLYLTQPLAELKPIGQTRGRKIVKQLDPL